MFRPHTNCVQLHLCHSRNIRNILVFSSPTLIKLNIFLYVVWECVLSPVLLWLWLAFHCSEKGWGQLTLLSYPQTWVSHFNIDDREILQKFINLKIFSHFKQKVKSIYYHMTRLTLHSIKVNTFVKYLDVMPPVLHYVRKSASNYNFAQNC